MKRTQYICFQFWEVAFLGTQFLWPVIVNQNRASRYTVHIVRLVINSKLSAKKSEIELKVEFCPRYQGQHAAKWAQPHQEWIRAYNIQKIGLRYVPQQLSEIKMWKTQIQLFGTQPIIDKKSSFVLTFLMIMNKINFGMSIIFEIFWENCGLIKIKKI